ncbi:hypothetical protein N7476_006558 [Penicillium atrosanguineum]|uniref:Pentapeptide repeat-containing protein n=1 Tax=Penicillium atrosanguineum TaxID=1132637 RepID=A0A9W9U4L7_9EURO|nr:hypothetical protein N7476_006558 [Penicillium atrosanguineum]
MAAEMKTARRAPAKFMKPDRDPAALKTGETPSPLPLLGRGVWLIGCTPPDPAAAPFEVAAEVSTAATGVSTGVVIATVEIGLVRVTVVGVAAQCVQTVTVVVQPSGTEADVVAAPVAGPVTLAVASGHQVVVSVVVSVIVVKPVGQMSVYDVTITVVMTSPDATVEVVIWGPPVTTEVLVTTGVPVTVELPDEEDPVAETPVDEAVLPWVEEDSELPEVDEVSLETEPLDELVAEFGAELETALEGSTLEGAALEGAALDGATLEEMMLDGAALEGIALEGVTLDGATLDGAILDGATLEGATLEGAMLEGATLEGATLEGATLEGAMLEGATLEGATLEGATLEGATLEGATLEGATLEGATLEGATLEGAMLDGATLEGATLEGATLEGAALEGATLEGATLEGATLEGATLEGITLEGATLDGATLEGATLEGATLEGATLEGATLEGITLEGATLDGATLEGATLEGATLEGATLEGITLEGATLDGAMLEGATLEGATLDGATLDGATLDGATELTGDEVGFVVGKILHILSVVKAQTVDIALSGGSLPQHYTTEMVRIEGHIDEQNSLHLRGLEIIRSARCIFRSWETYEKLCVRVGTFLDDLDPTGEVETTIEVVRCRATCRVIKLDPNEIEHRVGNSIAELLIRNTALRRSRDIEGLIGEVGEPGGYIVILEFFIGRVTSNREHDSLSILFTDWEVLPDLVAAAEQMSAVVYRTVTLIAKVRARPGTHGRRQDVDESNVDDV